MKMKGMFLSFTIVAALVTPVSVPASASTEGATIPETMTPGTIITYDANNQPQVEEFDFSSVKPLNVTVQSNQSAVDDKKKEEDIVEKVMKEAALLPKFSEGQMVLPKSEPGMIVYYDGMGYPTKVLDSKGNFVDLFPQDINLSWEQPKNGTYTWDDGKQSLTITDDSVVGVGKITWYNGVGKKGADQKKLTNDNCATKMKYDRPSYNTEIKVTNVDNDKEGVVYKADVGSLPHAVLDIMPDKMSDTFGAKVNKKKGLGNFNGKTSYSR
ncbi:hypothetical protein [Paenibacillus polymyxa]|uniref:hypothetical protein n=1 Tax=Paenibacillus polymyxa TaxID=1406 RepID=UPI0032179AD1